MTDLLDLRAPKASSWSAPPDGRTWRIGVCWKAPPRRGQMVAELSDARSRKLSFNLRAPATASCVIDGRSPQCAQLQELSQDLILSRWDGGQNRYVTMFRGPVGQTQDTISETTHTVNVNAADYRAYLARAVLGGSFNTTVDQDEIVRTVTLNYQYGAAQAFMDQGLLFQRLNPDGTTRGPSGVQRTRQYTGAEKVGDLVDNLSNVSGGFEWGVEPGDPGSNLAGYLNVWYPQRGVTKTFVAEYGATMASLSRTVQSTTFANWVRNDGQNNADGTPMFAMAYGDVISNPQLHPEGLWQEGISHSDVNQQTTLQQQADGELALASVLVPSYKAVLAPGAWLNPQTCWLGDTIGLRVRSGRLAVDTTVRIVGVDIDIADTGAEKVSLTLGRSELTFSDVMADNRSRLDALSRR